MSVLSIERVQVAEKDIHVVVRVRNLELLRTSAVEGLAARAMELMPGLERHRCENDTHSRLLDELRDTEAPHLLEHLTVELMALAGSPRTLPALTTWDFEKDGVGVFRLRIGYDDDLVVLGALKEANLVVDWLYHQGERPNIGSVVSRLKKLRATA